MRIRIDSKSPSGFLEVLLTNEMLIPCHLAAVVATTIGVKKLGKEGLGALFTLFLVISNLFVTKEIQVAGLMITTCDVYTIGSILCLNLIQEIYGKKESRKYLYRGILFLCVFLAMSLFQNAYLSAPYSEEISVAFKKILNHTPRIIVASLIVTLMSDRIDMFIFQTAKQRFPNHLFVTRFLFSTVVSQLVDTLLFSFLALYGVVENIWHCIFVAYFVKVIMISGSALCFFFTKKDFYKDPAWK